MYEIELGFTKRSEEAEYIYDFTKHGKLDFPLAKGYRFFDNATEEIDVAKLDACLHYGFNHEGEPDGDLDFRIHMLGAPHISYDLLTIVVDEATGDYAGYGGMFVEPKNELAYLEPLCVRPEHRRKGIAAAIISELIRRTEPRGARFITGGEDVFYPSIGYEVGVVNEFWRK